MSDFSRFLFALIVIQGRHELTLGHSTETDGLYKEMMKVKDELRLVKTERNQIETKMNESAQVRSNDQ